MCIACELRMFFAMEDIAPSTGAASHQTPDEAPRFACEAPADKASLAAQSKQDERKP